MGDTSKVQVEVVALLKDLFSRPAEDVAVAIERISDESDKTAQAGKKISAAMKQQTEESERVKRAFGSVADSSKKVGDESDKTGKKASKLSTVFDTVARRAVNTGSSLVSTAFKLSGVGAVIGTVASALGATRLIGGLYSTAKALDEINASSVRTGATVKSLSSLQILGELQNVDTDPLFRSIGTLQKRLSSLSSAQGKEASRALRELGIDPERARATKDVTDLLPQIADGIASLSTGDRLRVLDSLFGRSKGQELLPLFDIGSAQISKTLADIDRLNLAFTEVEAKVGDDLTDAILKVGRAWEKVKAVALTAVGPALIKQIDAATGKVTKIRDVVSAVSNAFDTLALAGFNEQRLTNALDRPRPLDRPLDSADRQISSFFPSNEQLRNAAQSVIDESLTASKTILVESGRIIGAGILETLRVGIALISPPLIDALRDGIGQVLNRLPGVSIERTPRGQFAENAVDEAAVEQLKREIENLTEARAGLVDALQNSSADDLDVIRGQISSLDADVSFKRREIRDTEARINAFKLISGDLQRRIQRDDSARAKALSDQLASSYKVINDTSEEAGRRIDSALAKVTDANKRVNELRKDLAAVVNVDEPVVSKTDLFSKLRESATSFGLTIARLTEQTKEWFDGIVSKAPKAAAALTQLAIDLEARRLAALGGRENTDRAEQLKQEAQFAKERADLVKLLGTNSATALIALQQVQDLEAQSLLVRQKLNAATEEASRIEGVYQSNLAEREALQKAGQLTGTEVAKANSEEAKAARDRLIAIRDGLKQLADESPEFARQIEEALKRINSSIRQLTQPDQGDFVGGLKAGFQNFVDDAARIYDRAKQLGGDLANAGASSISGFLSTLKSGTTSAGEAFEEFYIGLVNRIADLVIQFTVLQAVAAGLGSLGLFGGGAAAATGGGGGGVASVLPYAGRAGLNKGGRVPGFADGGRIPGSGPDVDSVLIAATPKEYMVRREASNYYDDVILDSINRMLIPREALAALAGIYSGRGLPAMTISKPPRGGYQGLNSGGRVATGGGGSQAAVIVSSERMAEELTQGKSRATLERLVRDVLGRR